MEQLIQAIVDGNQIRHESAQKDVQRSTWDGYLKPNIHMDIDALTAQIDRFMQDDSMQFINLWIPHPYYRKQIREYLHEMDVHTVSWIDVRHKVTTDDQLLYHNACKGVMVYDATIWSTDYTLGGAYYQSEASCIYCNEKLLSDYVNTNDSSWGHRYVRGKNSLHISKIPLKPGARRQLQRQAVLDAMT